MMEKEKDRLSRAVIEFCGGKEEAFNEIYELTYQYVYYTIYRSVNDEAITEDVMQETYLEVYKSLSDLKEPEAVKGWIARIAHHKIYRYLKNNPELLLTEENSETIFETLEQTDEALMPEDVMENRETQRLLGEILDSLSKEQRLSVVAFYFNQMSIKEISEAYGIPENTVKSYLSRGKAKIREGVMELEKKHGTKLYTTGLAAVLFFLMEEEAKACEMAPGLSKKILDQTARSAKGNAAPKKAAGIAKVGLRVGTKIGIAVAGTVLVGGIIGIGIAKRGESNQNWQTEELLEGMTAQEIFSESGLEEENAEKSGANEVKTGEETETADMTQTAEESAEEESSTEAKIPPYMEEIGARFDLIPGQTFVLHTLNSNNKEVREEQDFDVDFVDVEKFEEGDGRPKVEGHHYETVTFAIHANETGQGVNFSAYICDYYTGAIITFESANVSDEIRQALGDSAFTIEADGEEYIITGKSDFQRTQEGWQLTFTTFVPDDYDGICYGIGCSLIDSGDGENVLITDTSFASRPETWHFYRFD